MRAHLAKDMARPDVARFLALYEKLDAADRWAIFHRVSGHLTGLDRIEELESLVTFLGYYMFDDGNIAIIDEPLSHLEIELIRNAVERDGKDVDTLVREALSGDRRRVLVAATDDTPPARLKDIIEALEYNLAREEQRQRDLQDMLGDDE